MDVHAQLEDEARLPTDRLELIGLPKVTQGMNGSEQPVERHPDRVLTVGEC
jgi:hypothetical protein